VRRGDGRDERIIQLLVAGWSIQNVAKIVGVCEKTVRNARDRMCQRAERDGELARLKLWRSEKQAA
jgi:DNA-binding NarL/FixJ family response regulator